jgi:hypothetical protein
LVGEHQHVAYEHRAARVWLASVVTSAHDGEVRFAVVVEVSDYTPNRVGSDVCIGRLKGEMPLPVTQEDIDRIVSIEISVIGVVVAVHILDKIQVTVTVQINQREGIALEVGRRVGTQVEQEGFVDAGVREVSLAVTPQQPTAGEKIGVPIPVEVADADDLVEAKLLRKTDKLRG